MNKKSFKIERWQVIAVLMLIYDIIAVNISYASTLWLRFDFRFSRIPAQYRNLIKLSGYKPDVDIKIEYTGLRPGEKLYEEKLMAEEGLKKTDNDLIHIGSPIPFDTDNFLEQLGDLMDAAYRNKKDIRERVAAVVTTYSGGSQH